MILFRERESARQTNVELDGCFGYMTLDIDILTVSFCLVCILLHTIYILYNILYRIEIFHQNSRSS